LFPPKKKTVPKKGLFKTNKDCAQKRIVQKMSVPLQKKGLSPPTRECSKRKRLSPQKDCSKTKDCSNEQRIVPKKDCSQKRNVPKKGLFQTKDCSKKRIVPQKGLFPTIKRIVPNTCSQILFPTKIRIVPNTCSQTQGLIPTKEGVFKKGWFQTRGLFNK